MVSLFAVPNLTTVITTDRSSVVETLLLPLQEEILSLPPGTDRSFLIRAEFAPGLDSFCRENTICEQTVKSEYDLLKRAGFNTVTKLEGTFDFGMFLLTKHKKENYGNIARAWSLLNPGGTLVCAGSNATGVKSFEKNIRKQLPVSGNMHKNHCRVFWIEKVDDAPECPEEWQAYSRPAQHIADSPWQTQPGIFCWEKIDKGSAFLAENFPKKIRGKVADFGSGWGYLSHQLLEQRPDITGLDLYEDELLALDISRTNLENIFGEEEKLSWHWRDLSGEPPRKDHYNWIITNPPFHRSERTDVSLGMKFIENAARSLKRSGFLVLVANRQLPYEKQLAECFKYTERLAESNEYKILLASGAVKR